MEAETIPEFSVQIFYLQWNTKFKKNLKTFNEESFVFKKISRYRCIIELR